MPFFAKKKSLLACSAGILALGGVAAWPIKTFDYAEDGDLCDTSKEQYIQVEGYDFHDHPKFTMRWSQLTGECGAAVANPVSWEETYDSTLAVSPDSKPNSQGRVQLNIFVCAPFGHYEIGLVVDSYSGDGSTLEQRTAWELENGPDEYHIWDTVNTNLKDEEAYSPTQPGTYVWPFAGETGYYKTIYTGPLPPTECASSVPDGTEHEGCFDDSNGLFGDASLVLEEIGKDGMTIHICSVHCEDYAYFGVENGSECYCGSATEFASAVSTPGDCGTEYFFLCTGDATTACGGQNRINVYKRTGVVNPPPSATPSPSPTPSDYKSVGCYLDSKTNRLMSDKKISGDMSSKVCFAQCSVDESNTHFGTQYGRECWCGASPNLEANALVLDPGACDFDCAGDKTEKCGGYNKISAYELLVSDLGCWGDSKDARVMGYKTVASDMTHEVCRAYCAGKGTTYYGTQYGQECWCGNSYNTYGPAENCNLKCSGDASQTCGGYNALSVNTVN